MLFICPDFLVLNKVVQNIFELIGRLDLLRRLNRVRYQGEESIDVLMGMTCSQALVCGSLQSR